MNGLLFLPEAIHTHISKEKMYKIRPVWSWKFRPPYQGQEHSRKNQRIFVGELPCLAFSARKAAAEAKNA